MKLKSDQDYIKHLLQEREVLDKTWDKFLLEATSSGSFDNTQAAIFMESYQKIDHELLNRIPKLKKMKDKSIRELSKLVLSYRHLSTDSDHLLWQLLQELEDES